MQNKVRTYLYHLLHGHKNLNPARVVVLSFGGVILLGALLLMLPISSRSGQSTDFLTCFFTATSASCVTGLIMVDTGLHWSLFGQVVILAMIQLGGLGFMTIITMFSFLLHRKIGLSERLVMVSTLNLNDMDGVVRVVRHALMGTAIIEGAGAVILSACFIPKYGIAGGLWRGIFHSVSAFCNGGFDLLTNGTPFMSLTEYSADPIVLPVIMVLIVAGGLGFFVWEDILQKRSFRSLTLYSKMVIMITGLLIVAGAAFFLCAEWSNPATLGNMPVWQKGMNAFFQSITLRTAGFNAVDQGALGDGSLAVSCLLMLIGGSSGSTAGGLKTVTLGILVLTLRAGIRGSEDVTCRGREITHRRVMNALTLTTMFVAFFLFGSIAITMAENVPYLAAAFEVASAMATVGVTTGITAGLSVFSHLLLIAFMFLGRIGIMSFSIAFLARSRTQSKLKYPTFDLMVG